MNRRKNHSRKGGVLIMALMVVVIGITLIGGLFDMVYTYAWYTQEDRTFYVDHTVLVSSVQEIKGRIVAQNIEDSSAHPRRPGDRPGGEALHVRAVDERSPIDTFGDLRFAPADFPSPPGGLVLNAETEVHNTGVGMRWVVVEVYDMFFDYENVDEDAISGERGEFFPPVMHMAGRRAGKLGAAEGPDVGTHTSPPDLDPRGYGAYLIRGRLYDGRPIRPRRGGIDGSPIRVIEEAFVQILP